MRTDDQQPPGRSGPRTTTLPRWKQLVVNNGYPGPPTRPSWRRCVPSARAPTMYVLSTRSPERLHAAAKTLAVWVWKRRPCFGFEEWNTGGYDWRGLGVRWSTS